MSKHLPRYIAEPVKLALKEMGRTIPSRQRRQAPEHTCNEISNYLTLEPESLRDYRDRALVTVVYDILCRR